MKQNKTRQKRKIVFVFFFLRIKQDKKGILMLTNSDLKRMTRLCETIQKKCDKIKRNKTKTNFNWSQEQIRQLNILQKNGHVKRKETESHFTGTLPQNKRQKINR